MKIYELIEDLHALQFRTQAYERKYGVTSQDFYDRYPSIRQSTLVVITRLTALLTEDAPP